MICVICHAPFDRKPKSKRQTCSRACHAALGWRTGDRTQRIASISASHSTPDALERLAVFNAKRWARPGERERLSEWNRRRWANPKIKRALGKAISAGWTSERRQSFGDFRRNQWATDVAYRINTVAGTRRSKQTPEARALFSELLRARWQDPVWRARWENGMRRRMDRPEERARMSAQMKRLWNNPVTRAKLLKQAAVEGIEIPATVPAAPPPAMQKPKPQGFRSLALSIPHPVHLSRDVALRGHFGRI